MRQHEAELASVRPDLSTAFNTGIGQRTRSDAHGIIARPTLQPEAPQATRAMNSVAKLKQLKRVQGRQSPWCSHQSMVHKERGTCAWKECPNFASASGKKRNRPYNTNMHCGE